jgi:hypothetical protein
VTAAAVTRAPHVPALLRSAVNFTLMQAGWFACVLGAAHGLPWAGTATAAAIVAWHVARAARPAEELKLVALVTLAGGAFDSALTAAGWVAFPRGQFAAWAAPHWIFALWALFATGLNVSLAWLKGRWWVAAAIGAVASPLSYWAGVRLGAATFVEPERMVAALALGWAVILPAILRLAQRYNGYETGPR